MNSIDITAPIFLDPARAWRTYIGGSMIAALHDELNVNDTNFPEEWLMSTVAARNSGRENIVEGLSIISGTNISLKSLIESQPEKLLGSKHYEKYGDSLGVLVKLIDAGERLTVQCHPTKATARRLFNSEFGKTECWYIIGGREINGVRPSIYYGFKSGISKEQWKNCFDRQDITEMLNCLHCFPVKSGEAYLIRGGIPHAIGAGCFLVEIQEPTDYTIRTEKITPAGLEISDFMMHQGLGFERMFECFEYTGADEEKTKISGCLSPTVLINNEKALVKEIVGYSDTQCFKMIEAEIKKEFTISEIDEFFGIYVLGGEGTLECNGVSRSLTKGSHLFVPACSKDFTLKNNGETILNAIFAYGPNHC